jgi:ParB family transcriptional regulator, chromosome partitioning protein
LFGKGICKEAIMKIEHWPLAKFKRAKNVRVESRLEAELRALGKSLRAKQVHPVFVQPDGTLISGYGRLDAAELEGIDGLDVIVADRQLSDSQVLVIQIAENFHRKNLTVYETFRAFADYMTCHPGAEQKDCAAAFKVDESTVSKYLSLAKLGPEGQQALKDGKLTLSAGVSIGSYDHVAQVALVALHLSGAPREAVQQVGRARRKGRRTARVNRIKVVVNGMAVVVSGQGLTLDSYLLALEAAAKEGRKAQAQGLNGRELSAINRRKGNVT